ncbi:hypothetical protein RAB80_002104 [Fusarium oxysporum f. sp. vasinfectum]|nr:hypothetical protein RAB80_002104 [Fusarium oxysporum f. sp. vasinfectum]
MKCLFLLSATSGALVNSYTPFLAPRQLAALSCADEGLKTCGDGCIDPSWTCCPGSKGGCSPEEYCTVGSNSELGCCPHGEVCEGPGGVSTHPIPVSGEISTVISEGIETSETTGHEEPTTTTEKAPVETTEANKSVATTYHNPKETASSIANAGASNRLGIVGCILVGGAAVLV